VLTASNRWPDIFPVLLPLHPDPPRVFPIPRMTLAHLMQSTQPHTIRCICNILTQRPPHTLFPSNLSLSRTIPPLGINVDRIDTRPPVILHQHARVSLTERTVLFVRLKRCHGAGNFLRLSTTVGSSGRVPGVRLRGGRGSRFWGCLVRVRVADLLEQWTMGGVRERVRRKGQLSIVVKLFDNDSSRHGFQAQFEMRSCPLALCVVSLARTRWLTVCAKDSSRLSISIGTGSSTTAFA
jgi:hypothetical protein